MFTAICMTTIDLMSFLLKLYSQENYLGYYLDEYCFKYNRQAEIRSGALCYELLYNAVHLTPVTYQEIMDAK